MAVTLCFRQRSLAHGLERAKRFTIHRKNIVDRISVKRACTEDMARTVAKWLGYMRVFDEDSGRSETRRDHGYIVFGFERDLWAVIKCISVNLSVSCKMLKVAGVDFSR